MLETRQLLITSSDRTDKCAFSKRQSSYSMLFKLVGQLLRHTLTRQSANDQTFGVYPVSPDETRKTIYWYDKRPDTMGTGFFSELFTHVGQWGTHVDPPAHFVKGLRTVDQIDLKEMILPLVVIDVHGEVAKNPDYILSTERLKKWETDHGRIPASAFVAMRTDWSKRWPDVAKMENKDRK